MDTLNSFDVDDTCQDSGIALENSEFDMNCTYCGEILSSGRQKYYHNSR